MVPIITHKRNRWCVRVDGKLRKFLNEEDVYEYLGIPMPVEESSESEDIEEIQKQEIAEFVEPEEY